jgi:hypothetical protein
MTGAVLDTMMFSNDNFWRSKAGELLLDNFWG